VKTGKYLPANLEREDVKPWYILDSIGELRNIFNP